MISNALFLIKDFPKLTVHSKEYKPYWKQQKRYIHEGFWSSGKWMPPDLYFYVNFWKIMISENDSSKTKRLARPYLRDLEWEKSYIYQEAKGFSGFELDKELTCHRLMSPDVVEETKYLYPALYERLKKKKFMPAREYLRREYLTNLGKPLYENQASNIIDIEARGGGKSYYAASNVGHNFLTDGIADYDKYLEGHRTETPYASETVVGAYDSKWSSDLLKKVKLGLSNLPGESKFNGRKHPSPIAKKYKGSWESGKTIEQEFELKIDGEWITTGTHSKIQHRTFRDNPFAANGTRGNLNFIEEVGFMENLVRTLGALKDCTSDGSIKFGVIWAMGTGGDMEGGATEEAKSVFYDTGTYDCLSFDDIYEGTGSIGLFVPGHMVYNDFRDKEGIIDKERALEKSRLERAKAKKKKDRRVYLSDLQNRPELPSEAFYTSNENILDVPAIKEHEKFLESKQDKTEFRGIYGDLIINSVGKVEFIRDVDNRLAPAGFPVKKGEQPDGCVVIWELPEQMEHIPYGMYIASTDPYDQDKAPNTVSMGSTFIMKRFTINGVVYKRIVAEYTGRPLLARMYHETVRRLCMFYNATNLYENEKRTMQMHFEQKHSLHLLADTPDVIKTQTSTKAVKTGIGRSNKGIGMPPKQQEDLIFFVKEYLETPVPNEDGILYLHTIKSIPLLKELAAYNLKVGNFDRVISLMLLILHDNQMYRIRVKNEQEKKKRDSFFDRMKLGRGANYVYNTVPSYVDEMTKEGKEPLLPGLFR